jgi:hypothetical protein
VKVARGGSNSRQERNRIRGTVIIISTVFTYLFSSSVILLINVSRKGIVEVAVKHRITGTPPTFVRDAEVHDEVNTSLRTCDPGCGPIVSLTWWLSERDPRSSGLPKGFIEP